MAAALAGFQKLHGLIGYFRPSEDMVGIDADGRVRVWLNSNFSSNYLFGPYYVEEAGEGHEHNEESMVREVVALVERNTSYEDEKTQRFSEFLGEAGSLAFPSAQKIICSYARKHGLIIPKYFVSLLGL
jgi:hypothetical protein